MRAVPIRCGFALALAVLSACTMLERYPESDLSFPTRVGNADVRFRVDDRRNEAGKNYHTEEVYGVESQFYGDMQFFPERVRVLATRFAEAIPDAGEGSLLVVDRFDIGHRVVRGEAPEPSGEGIGAVVGFVAFALLQAADKSNSERNMVVIRLNGSFDNVPFDIDDHVTYVHYVRGTQIVRVVALLERAADQAVDAVLSGLRAARQQPRKPADLPPLPLPRILPPRHDDVTPVSP